MEMKKRVFALCLALALTLTGCAGFAESSEAAIDVSEYFSKRDLSGAWDESEATQIQLNNGTAEIQGGGAAFADGVITVTAAGTYVFTGDMPDGQIAVSAGSDDKVQIVLNNANVSSASSAALLVENADKVFITLAEGTQNSLNSTGSFSADSDVDAAVFARDDIVFNGAGSLTVSSVKNGIVGKDDVKFTGGVYAVAAQGRGIDANDSIRIYDGDFTVVSEKDALRAKHDESDKGYILIVGGAFDLTAGGGAEMGETHVEDMGFGRRQWNNAASNTDSESKKGVKASGTITVLGGTFAIDTADDAIHSDVDVHISGGEFTIATGDDGVHAGGALNVMGGSMNITKSYEGLEGQNIEISGGEIRLYASDDGLNAAGGNDQSGFGWNDMFSSDGVSSILISGGTLNVNADGDGIDSNGDLTVTGGTIVISGPTNSGNGVLDCAGTAIITGGTLIAAGAVGMAENFDSSSTQVSMLVNLSGTAGTITVTDEKGSAILTGEVEKQYQCVVVSSPDLQVGQTYTVQNGSASTSVNVTSTVMGGGRGGFGGRSGEGGSQQQNQTPVDGTSGATSLPDGQQPPEMPDGQNPPDLPNGWQPQDGFGGGQTPGGMGGPGGGRHGR